GRLDSGLCRNDGRGGSGGVWGWLDSGLCRNDGRGGSGGVRGGWIPAYAGMTGVVARAGRQVAGFLRAQE
ncbi:MAG: hypothetical protein OXR07_07220, partial [Nitrospira sp.]|nr:hypothetical protein [Nitrospira sp.]